MTTSTTTPHPAAAGARPITLVDGYVPVIDVSGARQGDPARRLQVAKAIGEVCETSGFMAIVGHGVPQTRIRDVYEATRTFFALPDAVKQGLLADPADPLMRGFGHKGNLAAANSGVDAEQERRLADLSETYTYNRLGETGARGIPATAPAELRLPNKWPDLPGFREAFTAYYTAMEELAQELMRLFALALDLPEHWFDDKIDQHMTNLTANYYPGQENPPEPGQLRKGVHSDWGSLTILYQDGAPGGLQVLDKGGEWVDVPAINGSFVINIGDLMAFWTNYRWVSTVHRVVNPPRDVATRKRYSVPFFLQPNYDAPIECIPTCTGPGNPPRHPATTSGAYLTGKLSAAYGI
ncbi:isopenicillin N synthase-like dioxygenase [Streptomyces olivoverticillatus]|uniref:Isopenicillin N synthase-like dioxygenase n=1 Tax=Streptomyces olivoverticillatus TaxID=66427 RepID=A0A7W7LKN6_9ACTN|nr:isopenicillin N synthase-like dioxygenase [Streptomyces olivoverticillatus]